MERKVGFNTAVMRATAFTLTLFMALTLSGCGGNGRQVNVDTGIFGNGSTSAPSPTWNGTTDDGTGGDGPTQQQGNMLTLGQALAKGEAAQYDRATCFYQTIGCEAARSIMPTGWKTGGDVVWKMQSGTYPAIIDFYIAAPDDNVRVGYVSNMAYAQRDYSYNGQTLTFPEGTWDDQSLAPIKSYQDAETYTRELFEGYIGGVNVDLLETQGPTAEIAQELEKVRKQYDQMMTQVNAPAVEGRTVSYAPATIDAATDIMRYSYNGVTYKACASTVIASVLMESRTQGYGTTINDKSLLWFTGGFYYYIAEESRYDECEAIAIMFQKNLIVNQQWYLAINQSSSKLFADATNRAAERLQQTMQTIQQQSQALADSSTQNYSGGAGSGGYSSSVMDGWTNVITEQEYYPTSDGGHALLDSNYMHTYSDGNGFVQSNNSLDMPSGWNEVSGSTMIPGG